VQFDAAVGIDGIILSKADVDQKGGAALSISYVTKKPILFLGVGQRYEDLQPFSKDELLKTLEL
jgi:fused signal recognition particle receptor